MGGQDYRAVQARHIPVLRRLWAGFGTSDNQVDFVGHGLLAMYVPISLAAFQQYCSALRCCSARGTFLAHRSGVPSSPLEQVEVIKSPAELVGGDRAARSIAAAS